MRKSLLALALFAAVTGFLAVGAASAPPRDLAVSSWFTPAGHLSKLRAGVTYQASSFPAALRVTAADASWAGAQWKSLSFGKVAPFFGWVALAQGGANPNVAPRGSIVIMTAYARTPSVAATVATLRTRGKGATYKSTSPVKVAGFSGLQFDAQVTGKRHVFIPFSPRTTSSKPFADGYEALNGQILRVIVLGVRGKTLVVYIDNVESPADEFPAFLAKADEILMTLRLPA